MKTIVRIIEIIIPVSVRKYLRQCHRKYIFNRALKYFINNPEMSLNIQSKVLSQLIYGWDNENWSALEEYLTRILEQAFKTEGNILECGSGLSTILLGIIAQKTGGTLQSIEHSDYWAEKVTNILQKYKINSVDLITSPLKDYGNYTWYKLPENIKNNFNMVVCDGPPADTPGGRYGLLPVIRSKLMPGCTILLDDAERAEEYKIANLWANELGTTFEIEGEKKPYAVIIIPALKKT